MSQWRMKLIMKRLSSRPVAQNTEGKVFSDSQISYIVCDCLTIMNREIYENQPFSEFFFVHLET